MFKKFKSDVRTFRRRKIYEKYISAKSSEFDKLLVGVFFENYGKNSYALRSLEAVAKGVETFGDNLFVQERLRYKECDVAVIFGDVRTDPGEKDLRQFEQRMKFKAEVKGRHVSRGLVIVDTAVLTRGGVHGSDYRRIGLNSISADNATFIDPEMVPGRLDVLKSDTGISLKPWTTLGDNIVIALQRPLDASLRGSNLKRARRYYEWVVSTVAEIKSSSHRDILVRPHPASFENTFECKWLEALKMELQGRVVWGEPSVPFSDVLKNAWATVAFSSGASVDSVLSGVPSISCDPGSFAWEVTRHDCKDIETAFMPDRTKWLEKLACIDWSLDELSSGTPWGALRAQLLLSNGW